MVQRLQGWPAGSHRFTDDAEKVFIAGDVS
jgi:hypothetical protein